MIFEIPFEPITITLGGNDFVLPNEEEAMKFLEKVEARINFGFKPDEHISVIVGDGFELKETPFYSDAENAYTAWCLL